MNPPMYPRPKRIKRPWFLSGFPSAARRCKMMVSWHLLQEELNPEQSRSFSRFYRGTADVRPARALTRIAVASLRGRHMTPERVCRLISRFYRGTADVRPARALTRIAVASLRGRHMTPERVCRLISRFYRGTADVRPARALPRTAVAPYRGWNDPRKGVSIN